MTEPIWLSLMSAELRDLALDRLGDDRRVGDEDVVADQLRRRAHPLGQRGPAVPVALGQPVLDRPHRVLRDHRGVALGHVGAGQRLAGDVVGPVAVELARRRVQRDRDALATGRVAGLLDRADQQLEHLLGLCDLGGEPALVAQPGGQPGLGQQAAQGPVHVGAGADRLGHRRGADRRDHELLEVQRVRRVGAAVEHVEVRHRQARARRPRAAGTRTAGRRRPPPWPPPSTRRRSRSRPAAPCWACRPPRPSRRPARPGRPSAWTARGRRARR